MSAIQAKSIAACLFFTLCLRHPAPPDIRISGVFAATSQNEEIALADSPTGFKHSCMLDHADILLEVAADVGQDDIPLVVFKTSSPGYSVILPLTLQGKLMTKHQGASQKLRRILIYSGPLSMVVKKNESLRIRIVRSSVAESAEMYYEIRVTGKSR